MVFLLAYFIYLFMHACLPASLNLERKRQNKNLSSCLNSDLGELTFVRILTLYQLRPVFPGYSLQAVEWVGLTLVMRNCTVVKIVSLYPWWWVFVWDPFFSRAAHKWISVSNLKVLYCGYCNLRLCLVKFNLLIQP